MAVPTAANGDGATQNNYWPMPKFFFSVDIGDDTDLPFQEVSGLDVETDVTEYRHGNSPYHAPIKMPGLRKYSDVTLKKGIFTKDNKFFDWFNPINLNTIERKQIIIKLLDEGGNPLMTWTLDKAFPKQVQGTDLNSQSSDVAVETIVFAHEGMIVATP